MLYRSHIYMSAKIFSLVIFFLVVGTLSSKAQILKNHEKSHREEIHKRFARQIAPGTKWCGNGDRASSDEDLGYFRDTDKCCRQHDKCPMNMKGKEEKYGLKNPDIFTRSHCDCDKLFYECLISSSSRMSRAIGVIYFNFLGKKCFREKKCPVGKTCDKVYEWVDGTAWLPTEDKLERMYRLMALLVPELEIDPYEDYFIGKN